MLKNHFKIAFRNLWRHKWFSLLNISGLAIGLTAGFLIFLYVSFELSYDGFHSKGDDIYRVVADIKTPSEVINGDRPAWPVAPNLESEFPEIESAVRVLEIDPLVRIANEKYVEDNSIAADSSFFKIFDFELVKGDENTALKAPFNVVLSETTAKKYFGDEDPIGKSIVVFEGEYPAQVTGVMEDIPLNSQIQGDLVMSMSTFTENLFEGVDEQWGNYGALVYILVNSGTTAEQLEQKFPGFLEKKSGTEMRESQMFVSLFLEPFEEVYLHSDRGGIVQGSINNVYVFSFVALFILVIASINFINLTTARSVERAKEVGIRKVVGAQKRQLGLQFLGESVIVCFLAFILSLGLIYLLLPSFNEMAGKVVAESIFSYPSYLLLLFAVAIGLGVVAGIYPALVLSSFKPVSVLKGRFSAGKRGVVLRKGLVVSQFIISIVLIIGTLVIYNQMDYMRNTELGFSKEQVVILKPNGHPAQKAMQRAVENIPGVKETSFGSSIPGGGNAAAYSELENKQGDLQIANLDVYFVDFDYMKLFDLKVLAGRGFSKDFATDTTQAMVVNERVVQLLGYNSPEEAIGQRFRQWGREGQIIGVVQDFHYTSLKEKIEPLTMRIEPDRNNLLAVKVDANNVQKTIATLETEWSKFIPQQPFDYYFLDEFFDRQYRAEERFGNLVLYFSILAIFISCLGLLGLASYSTLQRKREIGIRKIVGASVTRIVHLLSYEFLKLVLIAFVIASPIAWLLMNKWLQDFAYRIDIHWWIFALAGLAAISIAILTVSFQAIKAAIANPINSLRTE